MSADGPAFPPAPETVELRGGPMDGWRVKPTADSLTRDWWRTWPPSLARRWRAGRYVRAGKTADWREDQPSPG